MRTLFISDIHLSVQREDITQAFLHFLHHTATTVDRLYILGDLFEFWVGDDDLTPFHLSIMHELKLLVDSGVRIYFQHGNRDFMIGKRFAKRTGIALLPEEQVITVNQKRILLMHGDSLCTDDERYQAYRKKVNQPWLQWLFLRLPLSYRRKLGHKIHSKSGQDKQQKSVEIMDVNAKAVEAVMQKHQVHYLIHGHTHRPKVHKLSETPLMQRIVLGAWFDGEWVLDAADL